jgi:hypothetical protein
MVWMMRILLVCAVVGLGGCGGNTGVETPETAAPPPAEKPAVATPPAPPSVD